LVNWIVIPLGLQPVMTCQNYEMGHSTTFLYKWGENLEYNTEKMTPLNDFVCITNLKKEIYVVLVIAAFW
jgi:hypothetical protein